MTSAPPPAASVTVRTDMVFRQELTPTGRFAFTLLGLIVFVLGLYLLASGIRFGLNKGTGAFAQNFLEWLVIIALFVVGVTNLISGAVRAEGESTGLRAARLAIGVIVLALGVVAIWPVAFGTTIAGWSAFTFLWVIIAAAFSLEGIFLILVGLAPRLESWQRALAIALGVVVLAFAVLSWYSQEFTVFVVWVVFSVVLIAFGIRYLVTGISGVRVHTASYIATIPPPSRPG